MSKRYTPHFGGNPRILVQPAGQKSIWADGTTVPADGTAGHEPGALFTHTDGSAGQTLCLNDGTAASCNFNYVATTSDGTQLTATGAELNRVADASGRIVVTTATALSLTATQHAERLVIIETNSTVANTFTLPAATGSGDRYTLVNNLNQTQGTVVIKATGTEVFTGSAYGINTGTGADGGFLCTATDRICTYNLTTTGGDGGDTFEAWDRATGVWQVRVQFTGSGTLATPFSAS